MEPEKPTGRPPMPVWVKIFIGLGAALVVLLVAVAAFGALPGGHGPGRHTGGTDPATTQPAHVSGAGHRGAQGPSQPSDPLPSTA